MKVKNSVLVILNSITLVLMLFVNYASVAGVFSNTTVGDISHKYDTLFAPAGYAFIIWSLIFLLCISFVVYQWVLLKNNDPREYIKRTGIWFAVSNLANALWVYCWTSQLIGWSVILIFVLLLSLCVLTVRLRLELDDEPVQTILFVWWPIVFYLGWIMVATIACIASFLVYSGRHGGAIGEPVWTIIMIVIACLLYIFLIARRNMREAAAVGMWAFVAIAVRQWHNNNTIAIFAIISSICLFAVAAIHAYKNRNHSIGEKIKKKEWK